VAIASNPDDNYPVQSGCGNLAANDISAMRSKPVDIVGALMGRSWRWSKTIQPFVAQLFLLATLIFL
jgi:hypothetical protein